MLRSVAGCIESLLRPTDQLGRLGGDEFLVVLGPDTSAETAGLLAARIGAALPALGDGFEQGLEIGASIGVAEAIETDDFDSLLKRADAAMYKAKNRSSERDQTSQGSDRREPSQ